MEMDNTSSERSPSISDNAGGLWLQCWDNEDSSVSGLNLESHTLELHKLVEDKEIAARAVAFVINSTRKGIVPLCADVANLFRAKRSLELKLADVTSNKSENGSLQTGNRGSVRTSHSPSPTPPSIHQYSDREHSHTCSRCSPCSSTMSNSPKLDKVHVYQRSPRTTQRIPSFTPADMSNVEGIITNHANVTKVMVHHAQTSHLNGISSNAMLPNASSSPAPSKRKSREPHESLPQIVSVPDKSVPKVRPAIQMVSKEVQCTLLEPHSDQKLEDQFRDTVRLNSRLAEDLGAARKEIEILTDRLKELEMTNLARQYTEQFYVEDECTITSSESTHLVNGTSEASFLPDPSDRPSVLKKSISANSPKTSHNGKRPLVAPLIISGRIPGCKCSQCCDPTPEGAENCSHRPKGGWTGDSTISSKILVQVDDHVVIKGDRTGYVHYVGHLDKIGEPSMVFVGLELDAPVGHHDGFFQGHRYFMCRRNHGVFVPVSDIICIIEKKSYKQSDSFLSKVHRKPSDPDKTRRKSPKMDGSSSTQVVQVDGLPKGDGTSKKDKYHRTKHPESCKIKRVPSLTNGYLV